MRVNLKGLRLPLLLCLLAASLIFFVSTYWYSVVVPKPVQEDDIREAVLRQAFKDELANCGPEGEACCISIEGIGDPSVSLFARFRDQLKRGAECKVQEGTLLPVEIKTGRSALIIHMGKVRWYARTRAEVNVSTYCGMLCGGGGIFDIHRESEGWVVEARGRWVS